MVEERALTGFRPGFARTPLEVVIGIRDAVREGRLEEAASYLDLRYLPEALKTHDPKQLVRGFAFVWNQQNIINIADISDAPEGNLDDDLPSYRDQIGSVTLASEVVPVYLQRIPDGKGNQVWRSSIHCPAQALDVNPQDTGGYRGYADVG